MVGNLMLGWEEGRSQGLLRTTSTLQKTGSRDLLCDPQDF